VQVKMIDGDLKDKTILVPIDYLARPKP
jgi:hypothetical protein